MKMRAMAGVGILSLCILLAATRTVCAESVFPSDSIVKQKCSACHKPDEKGRVDVIEETRKTPEEWKAVVDRMIRLNSAPLGGERFLSGGQGTEQLSHPESRGDVSGGLYQQR